MGQLHRNRRRSALYGSAFAVALMALAGVSVTALNAKTTDAKTTEPQALGSGTAANPPLPWELPPNVSLCSGASGKSAQSRMAQAPMVRLAALQSPVLTAGAAPDVPEGVDLPPLYEGMGSDQYPISTAHPLAQAYFDQGLNLTYGFNHLEAARSFEAAEKIDPNCAMCAWGHAFVLGPNINLPMAEDAVQPAFSAIARAKALAGEANGKERALITALATRYSPDPKADRAALDEAYREAMTTLARLYPEDDTISVLTADAIMNTQIWDYWNTDGTAKGQADLAIALVETVLERNPEHAGAIHLYIHLMEAGPEAARAEPHARRLGGLAPASGHLVHMPSHIYYRLGLYRESLDANVAAIAADEKYLAQSDDAGIYRYGYYPHNVHFMMTSAQLMGDRENTLAGAEKLSRVISASSQPIADWQQRIAGAPLLALAQFGEADAILLQPKPSQDLPYLQAHWHFARARARLIKGDISAAKAEADMIEVLAKDPSMAAMEAANVPAPAVLTVAANMIHGRIAWAQGDLDTAAEHFRTAAQAQDTMPYMEPPHWHVPVRQTLGAVLLEAGKAEDAESAFRRALVRAPNNGWALYGLTMAYERMGKAAVAERTRAQFKKIWAGSLSPTLKDL